MTTAAGPSNPMSRRAILRLALAAPVVPGLIAIPEAQATTAHRAVKSRHRSIRLDSSALRRIDPDRHFAETDAARGRRRYASERRPHDVFTTGEIETDPFSLAAVTWTGGGTEFQVLLRTRSHGGWSNWYAVHDDGHAPDHGSRENTSARRGTEPVITRVAGAIDVRIEVAAGTLPADLRLDMVDPGDTTVHSIIATSGVVATATQPTIYTRSQWGADETLREPGDPDYGTVRGAFIHHTAGTNSYNESDVTSIIRSIYVYHVEGRGWRDIGYNFLIDKFGRIWEGRYGGIDRAVVGAHVSGYNTYATGMSVLGTYTSKEPERAMLTAIQRLLAWKFSVHNVDASGTVSYPELQTLPAIAGHRDGGSTECPGDRLYTQVQKLNAGLDAAVWRKSVSKLYLFSDDEYVRFTDVSNGPDSSYPRPIAGNWTGLPDPFNQGIDAALWRDSNSKLYFFKGDQYIRYSRVSDGVDPGYPKPIAGNWPGLPASFNEGIDAAFWRRSNRKIYFFKGDQYIRYSRVSDGVDPGYPKPIAGNWPGLPASFNEGIDAALMRRDNGKIYFFKGPVYVRYSRVSSGIDAGYPKWIDRYWMPFPL